MHVWQLNAQGFQLVGHPGAWVVHRPHSPSAGYLKAFTGPRYTAQHQVHMFWSESFISGCLAAAWRANWWLVESDLIDDFRNAWLKYISAIVHMAGHRAHEAYGAHGEGNDGGGAERDLPGGRRVGAGRLQSSPTAAGAGGQVVVKRARRGAAT